MLKRAVMLLAILSVAGGVGSDAGLYAAGGPYGSVRLLTPS